MKIILDLLFTVDVIALLTLLTGAAWSVALPQKRIWPPPGRRSWQYRLTWGCFYLVFMINAALFVLDWNSWIFESDTRLILGVPLVMLGALLVSWGVAKLGGANTSGLKRSFVTAGPYRFTRNPQYLGDVILFTGLSLVANSRSLWVIHSLAILVLLVTPLAEEIWLEEQYGQAYPEYKKSTPRFL